MTYALHTPYGPVRFTGNKDSEKWAAEYVAELGRPAVAANTRIAELESELKLYRALCEGYTLEELQNMSLTFKAQIDMLRARPAVPRDWVENVLELCNDALGRFPMTEAMMAAMYESTGDRGKYPNAADWLAHAALREVQCHD